MKVLCHFVKIILMVLLLIVLSELMLMLFPQSYFCRLFADLVKKKATPGSAPFLIAPRIKKHLSDDGAKSMPSSSTHWQQMIDNPRRPVIYWHPLKVIKVCNVVCLSSVQGLRPLFLDIMSLFDPHCFWQLRLCFLTIHNVTHWANTLHSFTH